MKTYSGNELAEMMHDGAAVAPVPRGPPALAQGAWAAASESARRSPICRRALVSGPLCSDRAGQLRSAPEVTSRTQRDAARQDGSFSRSTARLTPQMVAEMTRPARCSPPARLLQAQRTQLISRRSWSARSPRLSLIRASRSPRELDGGDR